MESRKRKMEKTLTREKGVQEWMELVGGRERERRERGIEIERGREGKGEGSKECGK